MAYREAGGAGQGFLTVGTLGTLSIQGTIDYIMEQEVPSIYQAPASAPAYPPGSLLLPGSPTTSPSRIITTYLVENLGLKRTRVLALTSA